MLKVKNKMEDLDTNSLKQNHKILKIGSLESRCKLL